ncbi:hypothetical protein Trydic_g12366 [Trypoxylus dichotomus]
MTHTHNTGGIKVGHLLPPQTNQISSISNAITKRYLPNFNVKWRSVNNFAITFPADSAEHDDADDTDFPSCSVSKFGRGRPTKEFKDGGERRERSKICELRTSHFQALINATPFSSKSTDHAQVFSADVTLSIFIEAKLSRFHSEVIRAATKKIGHNAFTSYKRIQKSKKDCYPSCHRSLTEVPLHGSVDHAAKE